MKSAAVANSNVTYLAGISHAEAWAFSIMIESMKNARAIGLSPEEWQRRREAAVTPLAFDILMACDPEGELPYVVAQREALKARHAAADAALG